MRKLVVLSLLTTALLGITSVSAMAQAPADGWQVTVAPYLLGAGVTGTTAIGPLRPDLRRRVQVLAGRCKTRPEVRS